MTRFSCKNCTERHTGCHSKCEKYIKERQKNDYERELEHKTRCTYKTNSNGTFFSGRSSSKPH